jgi:hypothetical protein
LLDNSVFCVIFVFIAIAQAIIVQFGGDALKVTRGGLHGYHWLIAIILGFSTWIVSFLLKFLPDSLCPQFGTKPNQTDDQENAHAEGFQK